MEDFHGSEKGLAEIALADAGPYFSEKSVQLEATTQSLITDLNHAHFHTVQFTGLKAATKYAYRVGDGTNWSEWFHFRTASEEFEPFSFVYFGDAQNNLKSMWSRVIREAYSDAPKARFMIHAGDLVNTAVSDGEWGEWFGAGGWLNGMIPSVPIPGNHEYAKGADGTRRLTAHWRSQFCLPQNGPESLPETCYALEYQNLLLIGLNSNEQIEPQTAWLDQVLSQNQSQWVICTFHHPIFSTAKDRDNPQIRAAWKPLFDKYRVDLVLQGHDHTYGRTGLEVPTEIEDVKDRSKETVIAKSESETKSPKVALASVERNVGTGVQHREEGSGTVYVVSVSGPKMYNIKPQPFMKRLAEDTQLYQVIHIDGDKLRFEARTAVGDFYDGFELQKQKGRVNRLIETPVTMQPRLRNQELKQP